MEVALALSLARAETTSTVASSEGELVRLLASIEGRFKDPSLSNAYLFSLSAAPDQLTQWRAQASSGGYMIGLDVASLNETRLDDPLDLRIHGLERSLLA